MTKVSKEVDLRVLLLTCVLATVLKDFRKVDRKVNGRILLELVGLGSNDVQWIDAKIIGLV